MKNLTACGEQPFILRLKNFQVQRLHKVSIGTYLFLQTVLIKLTFKINIEIKALALCHDI